MRLLWRRQRLAMSLVTPSLRSLMSFILHPGTSPF
jgi:hypothetical protein